MRIPLEPLLHLQRQAVHAPTHVRVPGRDPDPHVAGIGIIAAACPSPAPSISAETVEASTVPISASGRRSQTRSR